ncbi:MAG: bifunctional diaminohydroxyphosphoribosylaminopyrimidine deaminase/5-amino-6-(5-phosphoribosylamino)uracil reductase RibD [Vicingaceae bacterium]|nr:bifunctional diaminohydroxyphosphoribosylaminopyrimidine deaminase/5-amino-6-(5-phosphoribosylamino)uracil reductase RibD [Vicingaceae bacterium]
MNSDIKYMFRCLELAKNGLGNVAPNPMVGCVVVYENKIIGEGYHQQFGEAHAEVNAINAVKNKELLSQSTLYVNLEPCAHFGKTPPCADLIIKNNIKKVVIGCLDTYSEVAGKGIERLKNAGVEVVVGVLERESLELNKRFFTFHNKKRPYIILKWAETKDGFIDVLRHCEERSNLQKKQTDCFVLLHSTRNDVNNWITSPLSKKLVHKWRSEEVAIMVGTNTALNDNPQLNVREWTGKNPIRIVLDLKLRLPKGLHLFDKTISTLVFNYKDDKTEKNLEYIKLDASKNLISQCLEKLYDRNIQSVIIEGGTMLLQSFITENVWDEARVFIGNKYFEKGLKAPNMKLRPSFTEKISDDVLLIFENND